MFTLHSYPPISRCADARLTVTEETGLQLAAFAAHVLVGDWSEANEGGRYLGQYELLPNQDFALELLIGQRHKLCR
jgi:hypothetical protein